MSKNQTPKPITKSYSYFDLDTFEKKTVEREIPPFVPKSADEVLAIVSSDNSILTKAVNAFLKRQELRKIKLDVASMGGETSVVMSVLKPFRAMPPWSETYELNPDGTPKVDDKGEKIIDRPAQTKAILEFIRTMPQIKEAIKKASIAAAEADEDGDTKEDEE